MLPSLRSAPRAVATPLPTLVVAVRRLRDARRRWPELIWILVSVIGLIVLAFRFCEQSRPDVVAG